jgi:hypothetical protein
MPAGHQLALHAGVRFADPRKSANISPSGAGRERRWTSIMQRLGASSTGIAFRGGDHRRRAWVIGSPFDVWEIIRAWQDLGEDDGKVQDRLGLLPRQLRLALAYYREFSDEINSALALARRTSADLESAYPFIEVLTLKDQPPSAPPA